MKNSSDKPKTLSSLNRYIIFNMIVALLLIFVLCALVCTIAAESLAHSLTHLYIEENPTVSAEEAYQILMESETIPLEAHADDVLHISSRYTTIMLMACLVCILVVLFIVVRKLRKKMVTELSTFERALTDISRIAEGNAEDISEISSDLLEFDNICLSFNQLTMRLKDSEKKRKKLEAQQRKMIADISHDLKTPITVIQGYSKAVRDDIADPALQKQYLDAICRKSEMVAELIDTFHEYSKLDHPDYRFEMTEGDLCEYFREYLAEKYQELELGGFSLEADLPDTAVPFLFDRGEFKRVFENLISNSYRHNDPGTCIYAQLVQEEAYILIRIGDTGKGIPEHLRDKIFSPFVVGTESRTMSKGSGLGLGISKRIVEAHGGTISLADDPSGVCKTRYEIVLPAIPQ